MPTWPAVLARHPRRATAESAATAQPVRTAPFPHLPPASLALAAPPPKLAPMNSPLARRLILLLALSPALLPLWQILHFGVDIPFWDQFDDDLAGMHIKAHAGQLAFADLAAQHNEHRILIPRLFFLALGHLTGGNAVAEMLAGWAIVVATSLVLLRLLRRTYHPAAAPEAATKETAAPLFVWFLANLLLFSPAQWENWLWGIGIQNFMPMLWVALAISAAATPLRDGTRLALVVALAALATWTSGNGMLAWGLAGGVLLWAPTWREFLARRYHVLILLAAIGIAAALYFVGMNPPNHRGLHPYDSTLSAKLHYLLAFAGAPFASTLATRPVVTATAAGAALYLLLAACAARFLQAWLRERDTALCRRTLPWFAIAGFTVGSGLVAACARAGIGPEQATSSRYVTFALHLSLALIPLVAALRPWQLFRRSADSAKPAELGAPLLAASIGGTVLVLFALAAIEPALRTSEVVRVNRCQVRATALLSEILPGHPLVTDYVFPDATVARRNVAGLDAIGYLRPRLFRSPEVKPLAAPHPPPAEKTGRLERVWEIAPGEIAIVGWAVLPDPVRPADAIVISVAGENGEPIIANAALTGAPRPDKAAELGAAANTCGWMLRTPAARLVRRSGTTTVAAWALDSEQGKLYPLAGTVTLGP